uniref:Chitin-binding type-2 domain-containing protein n=1 Tax=Photinus pyralis TaxID=7054 RepID=A0A1Y1LLE1_PHOPY
MKVVLPLMLAVIFADVKSQAINNSTFCKQPGYACSSCNQVVLCVQNEANFTEYPIASCGGNSSCSNGICIVGPNPQCDPVVEVHNATFICRTTGMYPDPFDTQLFHHCVKTNNRSCSEGPLEHFEDRCDCDHAYNARTTFCDLPIKDYNYTVSIPECDHQGQSGFFERKSIFVLRVSVPSEWRFVSFPIQL